MTRRRGVASRVAEEAPELDPQPRLAAPCHELGLGDRRPLALPGESHQEQSYRIGRDMAVNRAGGRLFNGQAAIIEDEVEALRPPEADVEGGLDTGCLRGGERLR